ncbi:hypothetical protein [Candidatus Poriferisocius sp.]|uniref:hypothetical protein n=1 Tax=Candidatus Poriferisocius sp. TaxID=3101276 RepID=UPI003B025537
MNLVRRYVGREKKLQQLIFYFLCTLLVSGAVFFQIQLDGKYYETFKVPGFVRHGISFFMCSCLVLCYVVIGHKIGLKSPPNLRKQLPFVYFCILISITIVLFYFVAISLMLVGLSGFFALVVGVILGLYTILASIYYFNMRWPGWVSVPFQSEDVLHQQK